jgi:hypothetical protein
MRSLLCVLALTSCTPISTGPDGHLVDAPPKPDAAPMIDSGIDARPRPCDQLAPGDDPNCTLACTDWLSFAMEATFESCAFARCPPLLDGTVYEAVACLDPA